MLAGGLFLLGYAHSTNYGMLVLVSTFAVTTGSVNTTSVDIGLFLFIIGLVLKSGIGPFYI